MTEEHKQKLENCVEWETEAKGLIVDGWKLEKAYKETQSPYRKFALISCIHCGDQRVTSYHRFIKEEHKINPCTVCGGKWIDWAKSMIGKTVGHYKILEYIDLIKREHNAKVDIYFKVQCIYCGKIKEHELYNESNWNRYKNCPDCPRVKLEYHERRYKEYIQGAKARNIDFNLSYDEFKSIVSKDCVYCGSKPQYMSRIIGVDTEVGAFMNGIDRVDSNKGYFIDNCVPCCQYCNTMKSNYPLDFFLNHISKIYNHSIKQGSTTIENTSENDGSE